MWSMMIDSLLSFPARISNTPKFRIFRRLRLFPNPFHQLQIFYIEAICCVPYYERIPTSFNTTHKSYSSDLPSTFIFHLRPQHINKKFHFRAQLLQQPPPFRAQLLQYPLSG